MSGFFKGAKKTNASEGEFNQVEGKQVNTRREANTINENSNNVEVEKNTNSGNDNSVDQKIKRGQGSIDQDSE